GGLLCRLIVARHSAEVVIVRIQAPGRLASHPLDLCLFELWSKLTNNACSHPILKFEDVLQGFIIPLSPEMSSRRGINQLTGDAHAICRLSDAPFKDVAHTELTSDLLYVDRASFVGEA